MMRETIWAFSRFGRLSRVMVLRTPRVGIRYDPSRARQSMSGDCENDGGRSNF